MGGLRAVAVLALFGIVAAWSRWRGRPSQSRRFARGAAIDNCGCFGVYLTQPLRWWVLLEDAEFVALGALVVLRERAAPLPGKGHGRSGFHSSVTKGATDVRAPEAP